MLKWMLRLYDMIEIIIQNRWYNYVSGIYLIQFYNDIKNRAIFHCVEYHYVGISLRGSLVQHTWTNYKSPH